MGGRKGGTGPEGHEQGAPLARRDDPTEDRALRSPPLPPALPSEARAGGSANETKGSGRVSSGPLFSSEVFYPSSLHHHHYILGTWSDVGLCRPLSEAEAHL